MPSPVRGVVAWWGSQQGPAVDKRAVASGGGPLHAASSVAPLLVADGHGVQLYAHAWAGGLPLTQTVEEGLAEDGFGGRMKYKRSAQAVQLNLQHARVNGSVARNESAHCRV